MTKVLEVAAAILSSRETPLQLAANAQKAVTALKSFSDKSQLDIVVNGQAKLADEVQAHLPTIDCFGVRVRLIWVPVADKAATWNVVLHELAPDCECLTFIDGYASLHSEALIALCSKLRAEKGALAVSGIPSTGRTANSLERSMRRDGGIHGNLYALRRETVEELRRIDWRLPLGIYRTDPTLGAALAFGLNDRPRVWLPKTRIALAGDARWNVPAQRWWLLRDWKAFLRRRDRQAQGVLENAAVRDCYQRQGRNVADLPKTVAGLLERWATENPAEAQALLRRPALAAAWKIARVERDWSAVSSKPEVLWSS